MHTYQVIENNTIYDGMPKFTDNFHPYHENFPLFCSMLLKISTIPMSNVLFGKTIKDSELIDQNFRMYQFLLNTSIKDAWGILHLYIKDKNYFFKEQALFKTTHNYQIIPLTYKTMSKMTEEEILIIYRDFD